MYLKGIEVSGFKSFARKTEFRFEDGITGIVGPNGSGKSNVADAMRWVLGEQSAKQLRSTSMQDVIFAGTENRRAQGYAYVNIIFDNSDHTLPIDYDEVTIGRRVYRSGESEYLINSNSCRLKDVQELLFDTGIGKEGYSIIGQGQIDKILSGKPEDRRELFDEAAGIMKYKKRRKEAARRLEKEEESLVRINDILAELTRQEGPLKRQSEKARVYLKLHDRLRICDANEFLLDSEDSRGKLEAADRNLAITGSQLDSLRAELNGVRERYEELEEIIAGQDEAILEARAHLDATKDRINVLERDAAVLRGQMQADEETEGLYLSRKEELEKQVETAERQYADLEKDFEKLSQERDAYDRYLKELSERQEKLAERIAENDRQVKAHAGEKEELAGKKSDLLVNKQKFDTMSEQSQLREASLNG
ncbi:MAG: chromosome segregation SMC family protein, partial [Lachnospiraceae bacterium]